MTFVNLINAFLRSYVNNTMTCPSIKEYKESHDNDNGLFFASKGAKVLEMINYYIILLELMFILLPFVSIPLVKKILEFCNDYSVKQANDKNQ